jgi:CheY-like chemotaxis protein
VFQTADEAARQEMLAEVYLRIHALAPKTNFANLHPAIQVSAALEGLLRKLLEDPKHATPSTLVTLAAGVDLLKDLCVPGVKSDLGTNPPIRMLVVDDDPLARRAVVGALQMAFEKPEAAESGEAALALAAERPFDMIFLDVQMPGMDGFTACSKLRETESHRMTPVVFVTGHSDFNARTQMSRSGGSDFVGKPFLKSEITVKALTFALRGRLEKSEAVII